MKRKYLRIGAVMVLAVLSVLLLVSCDANKSKNSFDRQLAVTSSASSENEIKPGLYCLLAMGNGGTFSLTEKDGKEEREVWGRDFTSRVWVEVREGEVLNISSADLQTMEDRRIEGCSPTRLRDGFFYIGYDFYPGTLLVRTLASGTIDDWVCDVYANAHDLSEGPIRSYEFDSPHNIYIDVAEGEFLYLKHTEVTIPPS
ncbi:MAG TPA: hypothetical protein GX720_00435 [Clostridiaceae bacterium]|nr:hypothetical protein [Clostridiaceae bacterium]